jgi:hypothetical protein
MGKLVISKVLMGIPTIHPFLYFDLSKMSCESDSLESRLSRKEKRNKKNDFAVPTTIQIAPHHLQVLLSTQELFLWNNYCSVHGAVGRTNSKKLEFEKSTPLTIFYIFLFQAAL